MVCRSDDRALALKIRDALLVRIGLRVELQTLYGEEFTQNQRRRWTAVRSVVPVINVPKSGSTMAIFEGTEGRGLEKMLSYYLDDSLKVVVVKTGAEGLSFGDVVSRAVQTLTSAPNVYFDGDVKDENFSRTVTELVSHLELE